MKACRRTFVAEISLYIFVAIALCLMLGSGPLNAWSGGTSADRAKADSRMADTYPQLRTTPQSESWLVYGSIMGQVEHLTGPASLSQMLYLNGSTRDGAPSRLAITASSVASGSWGSTATWDCTCIPDGSYDVTINNGHNVTQDTTR